MEFSKIPNDFAFCSFCMNVEIHAGNICGMKDCFADVLERPWIAGESLWL